jgi:hypothetical protein
MLGAGLHLRKGFSPLISHLLYSSVARAYFAQSSCILVPLQLAHILLYLLLGLIGIGVAVPIYMMIERNMLSLLMNIIRNNTTVEYKILMRQFAMRYEKDHTFINRIQEVIQKYNSSESIFRSIIMYIGTAPIGTYTAVFATWFDRHWSCLSSFLIAVSTNTG